MATRTRVSLEEFLAMPETEPANELWDGEVVQKVAPNFIHGFIGAQIISSLHEY
jgi:Uma2 family endonuclease